jgi:uncharacterized membrane protein YfcA
MSWAEVTMLIVSGILVGFINTLAGGGTIITISLLIFLGFPITMANGTNRIAVLLQTLVAVLTFRKQKILDTKKGLILCLPSIVGSVSGSLVAVAIQADILEKMVALAMFLMLFFIVYKPERWLKSQNKPDDNKVNWYEHLAFLIIGFYGGFIHIGVGFFMIAALVLLSGFDLLKANAIKNLLVLAYAPFSLLIFMYYGQVNWEYGLVLSIGNVIGAFVASRFAVSWGAGFVRWVMILVIIITGLQLLDVYDFKMIFGYFMPN